MKRKTFTASFVAAAAAILFTFADGESSDAFAQNVQNVVGPDPVELPLTDEIVPMFVSEPVVQDVPEPVEPVVVEPAPIVTPAPKAESLKQLVRATDVSAGLNDEMQCLAGAIYFESRGEPLAGQLAVGQVIVNRAEARQFPASYCGVVYQRSQFSFVETGQDAAHQDRIAGLETGQGSRAYRA